MKLYVAGPMTGIPKFNFPTFANVTNSLRGAGYEVVSPHEQDHPEVAAAAWNSATGSMDDLPPGLAGSDPLETILKNDRDIAGCDGVALITGWSRSSGAVHEVATATRLSIWVAHWRLWWALTVKGAERAMEPRR